MIVQTWYATQPGQVYIIPRKGQVVRHRYEPSGQETTIVARLARPDVGRGLTAGDLVGLELLSYGEVLQTLRWLGLHFAYADTRRGVAVMARHPLGVWYWRARHLLDRLRGFAGGRA